MIISQCSFCKHLQRTAPRGVLCRAFPEGIPDEIYYNRHDHRKPFPGDHGVRWEPESEERGRFWEDSVRQWEEYHGRSWGEPGGQDRGEEG